MKIKSLSVLLLLVIPLCAEEPNWKNDFKAFSHPGAESHFEFGPDSVRMIAKMNPFSKLTGIYEPTLNGVDSAFSLGGNFEWHTDYDIKQFGEPNLPIEQEANASLSLVGRGSYGHYGINVGVRKDRGPCFNFYHGHPHANGYHFNMITIPRTSNTGRLALHRQGGELIFMAADGPDAPLAEMVRLPIREDLNPHLAFTTFQGQGNAQPTIDVTFRKMSLKAARLIRGEEARSVLPNAGPQKQYGVNLDYSKNPARLIADFKATGSSNTAFSLVDKGLRIHPPVKEEYRNDAPSYFFRDSKFGLEGDFEVSWKYDITALGPFGKEGTGTSSFSFGVRGEWPVGIYSFSYGGARDVPRRYGLSAEIPTKKGTHFDTQQLRTNATTGRMFLQRIGAELIFLVQEPQDAAPRVLARMPYHAERIPKLRIAVYQGNNCTNVLDAVVSDVIIKAERIIDADTNQPIGMPADPAGRGEPITLDSLPQVTTNKWRNLKIAIMVLGGVLVCAGIAFVVLHLREKKHAA